MLTLRKAAVEDCEGVWRVFTRSIRGLARSHYSPEQIEAWAALRGPDDFVAPIEQQTFFVAEEDDAIVGYAQLDAAAGVVEAVYVVPEIAGRGVGRLLLEALEAQARDAGLVMLRLRASLNAVGFYRHMGYEVEREEVHRLPTGVEFAVVQMVKRLAT